MSLSNVLPTLCRVGSIAAAILIVLTLAWVILLVHPSPPSADAGAIERLAFIELHTGWQTASFIVAALMAIAYIPVWASLGALIVPGRQTLGMITVVLGILFSSLFVIGYWTQITTVYSLMDLLDSNTDAAIAVAGAFDFSGNFWTASYGIVIASFVLLGLTTLTIFAGLGDSRYAPARTTAMLFGAAGLLAIVGAVGFAANISFLEHGILLSGVTFIPALSGTTILLHRVASGADPRAISAGKPETRDAASPVMSTADSRTGSGDTA